MTERERQIMELLRQDPMLSQGELAKRLGITRSSVNAWEMGISTPSTQYIAELAGLFRVSADYLLGLSETATVSVAGLTEADVGLVCHLISHLRGGAEREK